MFQFGTYCRGLTRQATVSKTEIVRQRTDKEDISDFDCEIKRLEGTHPEARKRPKKKSE